MLILGIETSCDETAAALARGPGEDGVEVVSSVVASQDELHARFGGIVPEVASRRHIEMIVPVVREAMVRASASWDDLEGVAVTTGPGLIGSLVVGLSAGKAIAKARRLPLTGVHHLEGHIYSAAIGQPLPLPLLALIASGGHSHLVLVREHGRYQVLGRTRDDAPGEAFEKAGRLLGLPYPGGPRLAALADSCPRPAEPLPQARMAKSWDFSFSGVKTDLARRVRGRQLGDDERASLAAAFQESVARALAEKTVRAAEAMGGLPILLVGGVARNRRLRALMDERASSAGLRVSAAAPEYCTDNGAMIAAAGVYRLHLRGAETAELDCAANLPLRDWDGPGSP